MKILKKRVNDTAIVYLGEKLYTRTGITDEDWLKIVELIEHIQQVSDKPVPLAVGIKQLLELIDENYIKAKKRIEDMMSNIFLSGMVEVNDKERSRKGARLVSELGDDFEQDENGFVYYKGVNQPLPKVMVDSLLDAKLNPNSNFTLTSLMNFWKYVLLNPDKHIREGLFKWLQSSKFSITEDGNIIAYRNVDIKTHGSVNKKLYEFVQESWSKIKRWKKSPAKFRVAKIDEEYSLVKDDYYNENAIILGHVDILKTNFDKGFDKVVYEPQHKGPYGQHIEFGTPVTMPRDQCNNDPKDLCSRGLHQMSVGYSLRLGNTTITSLINPYNVVAIPEEGNFSKFRCCEYYPIGLTEIKDGKIVEFEPGTYDIPYNGIESLEKMLETFSVVELQEKGLLSTELEENTFKAVFKKAKEVINNRVIKN